MIVCEIGDCVVKLDSYQYTATKGGEVIAKAVSLPELMKQLGM